MLRVGLIGCGGVSRVHMNVYRHCPGVKVVAASDIVANKVKKFAGSYGIDLASENYMEVLECGDLDLVDICTPVSTHAQMAIDAARLGRNILVEKPMARTSDECDKMISEAKKHSVKMCVCHNQRFIPSVVQARRMVETGNHPISSFRTYLKYVPSSFPNWILTEREGGILWEAGCHAAYLQLAFLSGITQVYAVGGKIKYPVCDNFTAILKTSSPAFGVIELSWIPKERERLCEIDCSDGKRVEIDLIYDSLIEKSSTYRSILSDLLVGLCHKAGRLLKVRMRYALRLARQRSILGDKAHFILMSKYLDSLRSDSPPPVAPEEGKLAIKLLECIEQSLNSGTPVAFK